MGVKTKLNLQEVNDALKGDIAFKSLIPTSFGARDTVYICDDEYILKLYELSTIESIKQEIKLYEELKSLKISKLYKEKIYTIKNKPCLLFEKSNGEVLKEIKDKHLKQIAIFLKEFHKISKNIKSENQNIYSKENLKKLIKNSKNKDFLDKFNSINIDFEDNGLIHGDLFIDNAIFKNDDLSAIIDFNEACRGDFVFDLAVVVMSWCKFDKENFFKNLDVLLLTYDDNLDKEKLIKATKYACLYYSVTRSFENRDYSELMKKYKFLEDEFNE